MTAVLPVREPGAAAQLPPAGDKRSAAGHSPARPAATLGRVAPWLVRGLLGLAVLAFALLAVGPHVLGYRTMTMLTGSMAPEINPGDVTIVTPIAVSEVTEGMVITYHRPIEDHSLVTHRVVSVRDGAGRHRHACRPRATPTTAVDPWTATLHGDTAYQVRGVIPELGHVIEALRAPVVTQALLYGAPALLVGWLLLTIWRPAATTRRRTRHERHPPRSWSCSASPSPSSSAPASRPRPPSRQSVAVQPRRIATTTVAAPDQRRRHSSTCAPRRPCRPTWTQSTDARISGYLVTVYFSDGFVQTVQLGPTATSWSATIDQYYVTAYSIHVLRDHPDRLRLDEGIAQHGDLPVLTADSCKPPTADTTPTERRPDMNTARRMRPWSPSPWPSSPARASRPRPPTPTPPGSTTIATSPSPPPPR